jgi:hypothetical protein
MVNTALIGRPGKTAGGLIALLAIITRSSSPWVSILLTAVRHNEGDRIAREELKGPIGSFRPPE